MLAVRVRAGRAGLAGAADGKVGDGLRRLQSQEGPRVDLGGQWYALRVAEA
jgi:hypothetical protein